MVTEENNTQQKRYVFFISHSTKDITPYVTELSEILQTLRVQNFVADRDAPIGAFLPDEVKKAIDSSELLLVILTGNSKKSAWVNQEVGYALGKGIPVIPLKKRHIQITGLIETAKYVELKDNPLDTMSEVFSKLNAKSLSASAQAVIFTVVASFQLKEKYSKRRK